MLSLKDKVAIVTGCGSSGPGWGNGKATAVLFARQGARIAGFDVDDAAAAETRRLIEAEGGACVTARCDATSAEDVEAFVQDCVRRFGRADVLVNNVGRSEPGGPVELDETTFDEQIAINLKSAYLACRAVLPAMERQGGGAIVNVSSVAGLRYIGKPQVGYSAAKAGLIQFTRTTAVIYAAKGVRLNCVVPGLMNTPLVRRLADKSPAAISRASRRRATRRCRWAAWATPGTSRTPRCSSLPTRRATSPRPRSSSTAASPPRRAKLTREHRRTTWPVSPMPIRIGRRSRISSGASRPSAAACCISTGCCCTARRSLQVGSPASRRSAAELAAGRPARARHHAHRDRQRRFLRGRATPPIALREGLTQAQLDALSDWEGSDLFDPRQRAVLAYADAMTRDVRVPDEVFAAIRPAFDDRASSSSPRRSPATTWSRASSRR